jgi:hypothetical protein
MGIALLGTARSSLLPCLQVAGVIWSRKVLHHSSKEIRVHNWRSRERPRGCKLRRCLMYAWLKMPRSLA